jgi:anaerobic selenocysteine-containing dehydrogenase
VLLPPTTSLEREHYDVVFHLLAVRNTSKWSPPLFPPAPGAKHDWEIFQELTRRLRSRGRARLLRPVRALVDRLATPPATDRRRSPHGALRDALSAPAVGLEARGQPARHRPRALSSRRSLDD